MPKRPGSESSTLRARARDDPVWVADSGREQLRLPMEATMKIARRITLLLFASTAVAVAGSGARAAGDAPAYFDVSRGAHPHDVAATPVAGGPVYYTAQSTGKLGILDPKSGQFEEIVLS